MPEHSHVVLNILRYNIMKCDDTSFHQGLCYISASQEITLRKRVQELIGPGH